jgi:hypothetical protein
MMFSHYGSVKNSHIVEDYLKKNTPEIWEALEEKVSAYADTFAFYTQERDDIVRYCLSFMLEEKYGIHVNPSIHPGETFIEELEKNDKFGFFRL